MRVLVLCPHFAPDLHAATGEVMTQLVQALAKRGHTVDVVTSLPWYRGHRVDPAWSGRPWRREKTAWGQIVRVWPFPTNKTNIPARAVGFAGMTSLAAGLGLTLGRHDLVMAMSPPVFLGDAAWLVSKRFGIPLVFNVQDIFPDIALEIGAMGEGRALELAKRHEASLYRRADAVTVLSEDQAKNVRAKLGTGGAAPSVTAAGKVRVIHNFVDLDRIAPMEQENRYRRRHGLEGKRVVMYSGNVGLSQPFELIRDAADRLADDPSVVFVINGEGAARPEVDSWAKNMDNVLTVNFGPREEIREILGAADLHLVILKRGLAKSSTPSKLYSILAAGRPVLASIDEGSEVPSIIKEAEAGRAVPPEDSWAFTTALEEMLAEPLELAAMGRRGRSFASSWLTPEAQAESYEGLFDELLARAAGSKDPLF